MTIMMNHDAWRRGVVHRCSLHASQPIAKEFDLSKLPSGHISPYNDFTFYDNGWYDYINKNIHLHLQYEWKKHDAAKVEWT